jgi:hypothetical protein
MHELSVAMGIVELAEEESQGRGGATISASALSVDPFAKINKSQTALRRFFTAGGPLALMRV